MDQRSIYFQIIPLIVLIAIMYFMLIRPQRKKDKEIAAMRSALKVGDQVVTIGGICGKIVKVKDDTVVIQVGADKVKFEMMKWSISQVVSNKATKLSSKDVDATGGESRKPKRLKKEEPAKDEIVDVVVEPLAEETKEEVTETEETKKEEK